MLTGYNTDIKHEGVIYHVQTEDGGTDNPVIVSLIYQGGRILASKKTSYAHLLGTDNLIAHLRDLLEHQHRTMIKAILTGAPVTGHSKDPAAAPSGQPVPQAPATDQGQAPMQAPPRPAQASVQEDPAFSQASKPPLEVPLESADDSTAERAAEKNLDQVILEYLASEIDKD